LGVGEAVGYAYGPATSTDRTEGRCRVVGVTPGGSTGAWILGMEFVSPEGEASGAAT
jgi:hypothetical protein